MQRFLHLATSIWHSGVAFQYRVPDFEPTPFLNARSCVGSNPVAYPMSLFDLRPVGHSIVYRALGVAFVVGEVLRVPILSMVFNI